MATIFAQRISHPGLDSLNRMIERLFFAQPFGPFHQFQHSIRRDSGLQGSQMAKVIAAFESLQALFFGAGTPLFWPFVIKAPFTTYA